MSKVGTAGRIFQGTVLAPDEVLHSAMRIEHMRVEKMVVPMQILERARERGEIGKAVDADLLLTTLAAGIHHRVFVDRVGRGTESPRMLPRGPYARETVARRSLVRSRLDHLSGRLFRNLAAVAFAGVVACGPSSETPSDTPPETPSEETPPHTTGLCETENVTSCGPTCAVCPVPANSDASCTGGACKFACKEGFSLEANACIAEVEVETLSGGDLYTCGVKTDGTLACWGQDSPTQPSMVNTVPAGTFKSVSAGDLHACGVKEDGTVACWGQNTKGETAAPAGTVFKSIAAGQGHSCGVKADGTVACWGDDYFGQAKPPAATFR